MLVSDYVKKCKLYENENNKYGYSKVTDYMMGLIGESGECIDLVKKAVFQGHTFNVEKYILELGDVCWYLTMLSSKICLACEHMGSIDRHKVNRINHHRFEEDNIHKLLDLSFSLDASVHRLMYDVENLFGTSITNKKLIEKTDFYYKTHFGKKDSEGLLFDHVDLTFKILDFITKLVGVNLSIVFEKNLKKLESRYPNGCFEEEKSINREENV